MIRKFFYLFIFFIVLLSWSCHKVKKKDTLFEFVSLESSKIDFRNEVEDQKKINIITYQYYYNGGGIAIGDINNDGLEDIYFTSNLHGNHLYLNKGNFVFEDITQKAGVAGNSDFTTGVTMADVNGDGLLDIYVCSVGGALGQQGRNQLFINNGNLTFTEKAEEYGLAITSRATQAVFFDYDNDGDLDMFLLNHSNITIKSYVQRDLLSNLRDSLSGDRLYRNDSKNGHPHFEDVTAKSGIYSSPLSFGLGVVCGDINGDGFTDLYITNDYHENNYLYINNGDGTFTDKLKDCVGHTSKYAMGCDMADFNNDGLLDIMEVDMLPRHEAISQKSMIDDPFRVRDVIGKKGYFPQLIQNTLQLQTENNKFLEIAPFAGVEATDWSWAPLFADFDNDGFKDLYITNGILRRPNDLDYLNFTFDKTIRAVMNINDSAFSSQLINLMPSNPIPNVAYRNLGNLQFEDVTQKWGMDFPSFSSGLAYVDLDNDGALDLVINNINENAFLFRNRAREVFPYNNFLKIKLKGSRQNSYGIGAKVMIRCGDKMFYQEQYPTRGFISSVSPVLNFGIGKKATIDSVIVTWPGGAFQVLKDIKPNSTIEVLEQNASGNYYKKSGHADIVPYFRLSKDSIKFKHEENIYNDIYTEGLIPKSISKEGPAIALGDVNNDGLEDFFVTGAKGQPGKLFLQDRKGNFNYKKTEIEQDSMYEGVGAVLFDADKDGDLDLYVVTAGNEYADGNPNLVDLLYLNDGKGNFTRDVKALPPMYTNGSCVRAADFDHDGYIDLFIGGRVVTGKYGVSPTSYLLKNDGHGKFTKFDIPDELSHVGMVTDALWVDIDKDGWMDLIVVGEWMPITIFKNDHGKFKKIISESLKNTSGWWNCITAVDLNKDGNIDFVVGNAGLNSILKASKDEPLRLYLKDFDSNGSIDPIITRFNEGLSYPLATKDMLTVQLPFIKKKFLSYKSYSGSTIDQLFTQDQLSGSEVKEVQELGSVYLQNKGNWNFELKQLPAEVNFSTVIKILPIDINHDGRNDLIFGGNFYDYMPPMGRQDASYGTVLVNKGEGNFESLNSRKSGLFIEGQVRDMKVIHLANKRTGVLVARNNERVLLYNLTK
jgi:hypothetical protein